MTQATSITLTYGLVSPPAVAVAAIHIGWAGALALAAILVLPAILREFRLIHGNCLNHQERMLALQQDKPAALKSLCQRRDRGPDEPP